MSLSTLSLTLPITAPETELLKIVEKKLGKTPKYFAIQKKSLDARDKSALRYAYTVAYSAFPYVEEREVLERLPACKTPEKPVLVVGSGPAGLFCALRLLERGIKPIVVERGESVDERAKTVDAFCKTRKLDVESNVQFGEGGAGTFSDGKLNTQTHHPLQKAVIKTFVRYGAPKEILYLNKPHIGSDNLRAVVKSMRNAVVDGGGKVFFRTKFLTFTVKDGMVQTATIERVQDGKKTQETIDVSAIVLALGHSARDTFETLEKSGVYMEQKEFAVGVRIEHLQQKISLAQYGKGYPLLPPADYKLVSHAGARSTFTFCMCPGGVVMPSTSEEGGVVTNGMSNYARNERNANSAVITQVKREDFLSDSPLAGMYFQRELERKAYQLGGGDYRAPVQLLGDFLRGEQSGRFGEVLPSYACGTTFVNLRELLPSVVADSLALSLTDMDKRLKGFACDDAVLTGVETRTSSPVRIVRDESMQSVSFKGLFPCGEGAGYAGGITSSAVDGFRVADAVYQTFLG